MRAIVTHDRAAGISGLSLAEMPYPHMAENDVIVEVHAASFTPDELSWPGTWTDRAGRDRTPTIPGHEVSGVVVELGFGTTGLAVGEPVFGLTDWARNGTLAEYVAVEARNLAPLSAGIDHVAAAAMPMPGLTAWQGLFDHGHLASGQTVLVHGAAGGVGSMAVQLALEAGARVIGSGRTAQKETILGLGVDTFLDLQQDRLEDVGEVDVVFDVLGGEILDRSAQLVRSGGSLVTSPNHPGCGPKAHKRFSSSSSPTDHNCASWNAGCRMGSYVPPWERCSRSSMRRRRSTRLTGNTGRPSSESPSGRRA